MASKTRKKNASTSTLPCGIRDRTVALLHEGWCIKESGSTFFGKTNWKRRWFKLVQKSRDVLLQYYRGRHDKTPAGSVVLNVTYCTRQLESHEKPYPNCFAVGPLVDTGALRTYYISCLSHLAMKEWMTVIDAAIQGVPEQAKRRLRTVTNHFSVRQKSHGKKLLDSQQQQASTLSLPNLEERGLDLSVSVMVEDADNAEGATGYIDADLERDDLSDDELCDNDEEEEEEEEDEEEDEEEVGGAVGGARLKGTRNTYVCPDSSLKPLARLRLYDNQEWRIEHWKELCIIVRTLPWSKRDRKDGVTISRCKFGRSSGGYAVIKIEGVLKADPDTVFNFLKISTKEGGKLDYIFRNETLLDEIEEDPSATIIFNQFLLPLPRVSKRDVIAVKMWIPQYLTMDESCGMVMFSVDHPRAPHAEKDSRRINIDTSGIVLKIHPGPDGEVFTHATILVRVALYGALHKILKGAYNSGLLKLGMRTTFQHMQEQLQRFMELTDL